jgi:small-conductance mechanosensitive channel
VVPFVESELPCDEGAPPILDTILLYLPTLVTTAIVVVVIKTADWLLLRRRPDLTTEARLPRQLVMLAITLAGVVGIAISLPLGEATETELLALLGIGVTLIIGLSSTSFVANIMAGIMLRAVHSFRAGDFVRVGDHFGRVTERGLFHIEIQTEDRDLTTLPNLFLASNPVTVVRASGTIVSASLSLGYDVSHARIKPLLISAAERAKLLDPFVQVTRLGDYAVTYRVAGFLTEVKQLLTARSELRTCVLDALHGAGVEIVSPTFMNQRQIGDEARVIPVARPVRVGEPAPSGPEAIIFDKADQAARLEEVRAEIARLEEERKTLKGNRPADEDARVEHVRQVDACETRLAELQAEAEALERRANDQDRPADPPA